MPSVHGVTRCPDRACREARADAAAPRRAIARWQDALFEQYDAALRALVLALLLAIIVALGYAALPALQKFGFGFFVTNVWNPVTSEFGALAPIYGTLVTSAIALLIGVPVSFGIALFLTEMCPAALKRPLGTAVELLAAIPSIIYGMWGLFVFAPFFADYVQPLLTATLRRCLAHRAAVPGRAERHRRADGGHHPGDHGHSVHRVGDARRVRDRAAGAEGVGVRRSAARRGKSCGTSCCPTRRSASSAASCSASAARSARRWR